MRTLIICLLLLCPSLLAAEDPEQLRKQSIERAKRWIFIFKTATGKDYLTHLSVFKAKIVIPQPPNWETNLLFEDLIKPEKGKKLKDQQLPEMYYTDNDKDSAAKVARALGLDFDPPYFIAFFPKDIEDDLASKEKAYRGLKGEQIFSTTFRVVEDQGKLIIKVTEQAEKKAHSAPSFSLSAQTYITKGNPSLLLRCKLRNHYK